MMVDVWIGYTDTVQIQQFKKTHSAFASHLDGHVDVNELCFE